MNSYAEVMDRWQTAYDEHTRRLREWIACNDHREPELRALCAESRAALRKMTAERTEAWWHSGKG